MFGNNKLSTWDDLRPCILRGWASSDLFKVINLSSFLGIKFFKDSMEILCQKNSTEGAVLWQRYYEHDSLLEKPLHFLLWKYWLNFLLLLTYVWDPWLPNAEICSLKTVFRNRSSVSFNLRVAETLAKIKSSIHDTVMSLPLSLKI